MEPRITIGPAVHFAKPCVAGTRIFDEYRRVDDALVFAMATRHPGDFSSFEQEILRALKTHGS